VGSGRDNEGVVNGLGLKCEKSGEDDCGVSSTAAACC
jgi:hypothetical protein